MKIFLFSKVYFKAVSGNKNVFTECCFPENFFRRETKVLEGKNNRSAQTHSFLIEYLEFLILSFPV